MESGLKKTNLRRAEQYGGFTLIELIAVMVLMAVLALTAIPAMNSIDDSRNAVAARTLLRGLTQARQLAVATGVRTWVIFDETAESWSVLVEDPLSPGRPGATVMIDAASGQPYIEQYDSGSFAGVQILTATFDGNSEIGFDWLGRPLNSTETQLTTGGEVVLTGNHRITVESGTGHVRHITP